MSSGNSYPRCAIDVRSSRRLFLYSLFLVSSALLAPWFAGVPAWFALPASVAALPASVFMLRWSRGEAARIVWQSDGRWVLVDRRRRVHEDARLMPGAWIGVRFLSLHWRCDVCGMKMRAALLRDNCNPDDLRRLSVRLRLTPDDELFPPQSGQWMGSVLPAKFSGTSTVSRGGCRSSRSG